LSAAFLRKSQRTPSEKVFCRGSRFSCWFSVALRKRAVGIACGGRPSSDRPGSDVLL
jgi:hypothetical protein